MEPHLKGERNAEVEDRCSVIRKEIQEGRLPADQRRDCFARLSHLPGAWLHARGPDHGLAAGGARTERSPEEAAAQVKSRFNRGLSAADIDRRRVGGTRRLSSSVTGRMDLSQKSLTTALFEPGFTSLCRTSLSISKSRTILSELHQCKIGAKTG